MIVVENFLAPAVCGDIRNAYDAGLADGSIKPNGQSGKTDFALSRFWPDTQNVVDGAASVLKRHLDFHSLSLDYCGYLRLEPGNQHGLHADAVKLDGTPNHTPTRVATAIVCLSDGARDHRCGVLRFPEFGLEVRSRPGVLVGFPTDFAHRHEVTVVFGGVRDTLAVWFSQTMNRHLVPTHVQAKTRMLAFDKLPLAVRDFMNASPCGFSPVDVLNYFSWRGEAKTLNQLRESEKRLLADRQPNITRGA